MGQLKFLGFHSKYAFKQVSRNNMNILYEGLLVDCDKDLLDSVPVKLKQHKFIIIGIYEQEGTTNGC